MRTVNYEALSTAAPLNKDAAVARDGSGETFEPIYKGEPPKCHWDAPLPCKPVPEQAPNLIGRTCGRLRVIGYLGSGKRGARWLVRCSCGDYESRASKAIQNPPAKEACCQKCDKERHLRDAYVAATTGRWPGGRPVDPEHVAGLKTRAGFVKLGPPEPTPLTPARSTR